MTSNRPKPKELVARVGGDDSPPELWTPGFADRKYVRNLPTVLRPSLPRPRALRLALACRLLAPFTKYIHPSVQSDGRTESQPDIMLEVDSTIYRLIKRFPFFFSLQFCDELSINVFSQFWRYSKYESIKS